MLSIFSVPKPFLGHIGIIQRNAILSWSRLYPACEIILCGDEPGTKEIAAQVKAKYIPDIARNEYGTPLLDSMFDHATCTASHRLMCYVNADIILPSESIHAVQRIRFRQFLMVGQRWDLDLREPWDFDGPDWEERLHRYVADNGVLHPPSGSDYFVFPRDSEIGRLPPFSVGRPGWDNWLIYHARSLRIPVIDATPMVTVVHQNHGYGHVPNKVGETWEGPEADYNRDLIGSWDRAFTLADANWVLTSEGPRRPKWTRERLRRFMATLLILHPRFGLVLSPLPALWHGVSKVFAMRHKL